MKIFFIKKLSQSLNNICSYSLKDKIYYLTFSDLNKARIAYEEISLYNLNWNKKLNGKVIEIQLQSHTLETKENLQLILNAYFNNQKNSFQAKRNKLIKQNIDDKKQIDIEIKYLNSLIYLEINKNNS